jgi:hypothetical protein
MVDNMAFQTADHDFVVRQSFYPFTFRALCQTLKLSARPKRYVN